MRHERMNKWITKMPPDSPIYSTKWAGKTHESSTYTFFQTWDNTEVNGEGTSWGKWSTSHIAQAPGGCGPRLLCEACGALTSHPQALEGAWHGEVLKECWNRKEQGWCPEAQKPLSGAWWETSFTMSQKHHCQEASPGPNLFFTSSEIFLLFHPTT